MDAPSRIYGPPFTDRGGDILEKVYSEALRTHRAQMKDVDGPEEKTCLMLLMRLAVQAAIDACEKDGCQPELDGVLDLCRDEFHRLVQTAQLNLKKFN